jgi:hypothetical protein
MPDDLEKKLWQRHLADKKNGFAAFQLALAYKRGKPVQPISGKDDGPVQVQIVNHIERPQRAQ